MGAADRRLLERGTMTQDPLRLDEAAAGTSEDDDPIVRECIEDALALFPGALTAEQEASHRMFLAAFIKTHPAAAPLYDRLRARPRDLRTVTRPKDDTPVAEESAAVREVAGGGRS
jgi:hypothetical protein